MGPRKGDKNMNFRGKKSELYKKLSTGRTLRDEVRWKEEEYQKESWKPWKKASVKPRESDIVKKKKIIINK